MTRIDPVNDSDLYALRKSPAPGFAAGLRESLRRTESRSARRARWPLGRAAAVMALVGAGAGLLTVPAVRASAHSFLAMFRVVEFAAIPLNERTAASLDRIDLPRLVGEHVQIVGDDGPPAPVATIEEASAIAGYEVRVPAWLPEDATLVEAGVAGARTVRVTADAVRLAQVMDTLGITDLEVPPGLHGQTFTVDVPPAVMLRWRSGPRHTRFLQAPSPVVGLPAGLELAALGEIGLRILGLTADEARQIAQGLDWTSTLLVPVPPSAQSFRRIDVNGHPGLAIEFHPPEQAPQNMLLWSDGQRVFALMSLQGMSDVMQMALSVR